MAGLLKAWLVSIYIFASLTYLAWAFNGGMPTSPPIPKVRPASK